MARRIESHMLAGPAGVLEALLEEPEDRDPIEACLVCHPHPLYGGTMHNKVAYRLARALRTTGVVVLRFNFRGVGRSQGVHDGTAEVEDARATLNWLRACYPDLPFSLAGFSFGARIVLRLGCGSGARRLIAVGFPTRSKDTAYLGHCSTPKIFIQSTNDEHGPQDDLQAVFDQAAEPKQLYWIEAADHFFAGALDAFESRVKSLA